MFYCLLSYGAVRLFLNYTHSTAVFINHVMDRLVQTDIFIKIDVIDVTSFFYPNCQRPVHPPLFGSIECRCKAAGIMKNY